MKKSLFVAFAALAVGSACSETPPTASTADPTAESNALPDAIVFTLGAPAPTSTPLPTGPRFSALAAGADLGGSTTSPLTLKPNTCSSGSSQQVTVTYSITGRQDAQASFYVNTTWSYNGTSWAGSDAVQIVVPARLATAAPTIRTATLTVANGSTTSSGTSSFLVSPFNLSTSPPAALGVTDGHVTVNVAFDACPIQTPPNTDPVLVVPSDFSVEATSSSGATVNYSAMVTANDAEDGDLTSQVTCNPASNTTFGLGPTTVNCSVTDTDGATVFASFEVTVVDTTPAGFTNFPASPVGLIASDIDGATLDISGLGITVEDWNKVSEPSTFSCDYDGTKIAIGKTITVVCKAKDAIGNEMLVGQSFAVSVGLDVNASGFLAPLRMAAPYSGHKLGSTIPHKFLPPRYADGTFATNLAAGLKLEMKRVDTTPDAVASDETDFSAGSTAWRYDETSGQYIFNAKTGTSSPWAQGTWQTTASYAGIVLATTRVELRK